MKTPCYVCKENVYTTERIHLFGRDYHKRCFKCENCSKTLSKGQELVHDDSPFCENCHLALFGSSWNKFSTTGIQEKIEKTKDVVDARAHVDVVDENEALDEDELAFLESIMNPDIEKSAVEKAGLGKGNICSVCDKTVGFAEAIRKQGVLFHKNCYKCDSCESVLTLGDEIEKNGDYYCTKCYNKKYAPKKFGFAVGQM
mmetsp:Transcript_15598/g.19332  ORF Transcript_15598/g.19332 Transcript_15598/m.19332 type:complete len:200 (+) Transcript_15598:258-857(+)|eukprot:CAMPEP_0204846186 /NCGR_PEP_ID=MMETSP1347-20130617/1797_1 /ASSEMBLY_ACC=CAM_ASM_000690 /TAXON_ID=215587 /ORGANISM="Aplanochytrium stocchinoi, Strain GSBS06" /LENGTH=199 /DNA_ID=CAMNT_0051986645 /DNA_START=182 /DNA_END=781 /DNA_ORIENTATION=-